MGWRFVVKEDRGCESGTLVEECYYFVKVVKG